MSQEGAVDRVQKVAAKMREAFRGGVPTLDSRAQCLELASKLCGGQHWHGVQTLDARRSGKGSELPGLERPADARGSQRLVLVSALRQGEAGLDALREAPGGIEVEVFARGLRGALPTVLRRVGSCMEPARGWSASAWSMRALGLFDAALPAILDGERAGAWGIDAVSLAGFASWDGISKLRSGCQGAVSEESLEALRQWARPWHSSFAKDLAAEESFQEASKMWGAALAWLGALSGGSGGSGRSWAGMRAANPGQIKVEASGPPMALASALLEFEGKRGCFSCQALRGDEIAAAARWFMPSAGRS